MRVSFAVVLSLGVTITIVGAVVGFSELLSSRFLGAAFVFGLGAAAVGIAILIARAAWGSPFWDDTYRPGPGTNIMEQPGLSLWLTDRPDRNLEAFTLDVGNRDDFVRLIAWVLDDLPPAAHRGLEHIAIEVSDGRRGRAYGLFKRDRASQDAFHDRIVIFRDALASDFSSDVRQLRPQLARIILQAIAYREQCDKLGVSRARSVFNRADSHLAV